MKDGPFFFMEDIRAAKMCSKGTRAFFKRHGLDWDTFLKEGLPVTKLEEIDDAMGHKVAGVARGRKQ